MATPPTLIEKINALPPDLLAGVEDFVDFIRQRNQDRALAHEPTFAAVWSNPEDDPYDGI